MVKHSSLLRVKVFQEIESRVKPIPQFRPPPPRIKITSIKQQFIKPRRVAIH